jgi:hypothetical protein
MTTQNRGRQDLRLIAQATGTRSACLWRNFHKACLSAPGNQGCGHFSRLCDSTVRHKTTTQPIAWARHPLPCTTLLFGSSTLFKMYTNHEFHKPRSLPTSLQSLGWSRILRRFFTAFKRPLHYHYEPNTFSEHIHTLFEQVTFKRQVVITRTACYNVQ